MYVKALDVMGNDFSRIVEKMTNKCVVAIDEVFEAPGRKEYDENLATLLSTGLEFNGKTGVVEMFHGTKIKNIGSILSRGLSSDYNTTSAFGKGTYFSPDLDTSLLGYTDVDLKTRVSVVLICDVIKCQTGGNGSNIFVCANDNSFLIRYLVYFHKNAK